MVSGRPIIRHSIPIEKKNKGGQISLFFRVLRKRRPNFRKRFSGALYSHIGQIFVEHYIRTLAKCFLNIKIFSREFHGTNNWSLKTMYENLAPLFFVTKIMSHEIMAALRGFQVISSLTKKALFSSTYRILELTTHF